MLFIQIWQRVARFSRKITFEWFKPLIINQFLPRCIGLVSKFIIWEASTELIEVYPSSVFLWTLTPSNVKLSDILIVSFLYASSQHLNRNNISCMIWIHRQFCDLCNIYVTYFFAKLWYVKDRMNFGCRRKKKLVRHLTNASHNAKGQKYLALSLLSVASQTDDCRNHCNLR